MKSLHSFTALAAAVGATVMLCAAPAQAATEVLNSKGQPVVTEAEANQPLTRERVREDLRNWKAAGLKSQDGEITDTPQILAARQTFYELQTEVLRDEAIQAAQRRAEIQPIS